MPFSGWWYLRGPAPARRDRPVRAVRAGPPASCRVCLRRGRPPVRQVLRVPAASTAGREGVPRRWRRPPVPRDLPTRSPMVACRRGCAPARATHRRRPLIAWGSDPAAGGVQGCVEQDQAEPARPRETDQQTPKPRRNACRVDGLSHHEECSDQHHRYAAEARERLLQTDDTGAKQGQGHTERDDLDRQPVPHKRRHSDDKGQNGNGNVRHEGHAEPQGLPRDTPARETAARDRRPLASRRATRSMATSDPARSLAGARRMSHGE